MPDSSPDHRRPWVRPHTWSPGDRPPRRSSERRTRSGRAPIAADVVIPGPHACANCGAPRTGPYCQACGQRHRDERMTVRELVRDVASRFFDLESGLLHTAWRLTVAPGTVSRDVIAGRRRRYAGPVTYLVVVATLSILSFLLVEDAFSSSVQAELATVLEEENLLAGRDPGAVAKTISRWTNQGTLYFSVFIAVVFAALGRWIVPGWKQRYNFAESCVFALYATAHGFLLLIPFNVLFLAGPRFAFVSSVLGMFVFSAYVTIAARTFVRRHWATTVLAFFAFAVSYFAFMFVAWTVGVALIAGVA